MNLLLITAVSTIITLEYSCLREVRAVGPLLKQEISDARTEAIDRLKSLESLLLSMHITAQLGYAGSTNGIEHESLQWLEVESDSFSRNAIILQTLILLYEYKLANYQIIIDYFQALEQEYPLYVTQSLLKNEEKILRQFSEVLTAEGGDILTKKELRKQQLDSRIDKHILLGNKKPILLPYPKGLGERIRYDFS